jgi:hypothetical protein
VPIGTRVWTGSSVTVSELSQQILSKDDITSTSLQVKDAIDSRVGVQTLAKATGDTSPPPGRAGPRRALKPTGCAKSAMSGQVKKLTGRFRTTGSSPR